jgi:hypothetical protein
MAQAIIAALESGERGENEARAELDSHADSPVVGIHAHVVNYTGSHVTVSRFTDSLGKKKAVPIVDAVVAYDCDMTGNTHLLVLHNENGNDFWRKAIMKEMKNTSVAFKYLEEGKDPPPGYEHAPLHLIFDVKMDFTRKARLIFGGHRTSDPEGSTCAGVVSRESVWIAAFTYAALMGLDIMSADIQNAYLSTPCSQKYYTVCGPEFGSELQGYLGSYC